MRNLSKTSLLLFSFVILFSCDKIEDLADVDFNTTLTKTLKVIVTSTDDMTTVEVLDATNDPEIDQYANKIKKYEITELNFAIDSYTAVDDDDNYFNGEIGFGSINENSPEVTCAVGPLNVKHISGTGSFPIGTCTGIKGDVSEIMVKDNAIKIYMTGNFTEVCSFDLIVTAKVKVTANPL